MNTFKMAVVACVSLAATLQAEPFDFTPVKSVRQQDGMSYPQLIFTRGEKKVTYEAPRDWVVTGGGNSLQFTPPKLTQAQATIEQVHLETPQTFDDATTKQLQQLALSSAPEGSLNLALAGEEKSPLKISGHDTYEVVVSYDLFGQPYKTSVLFADFGDTQLRFRFTAKKDDFEQAHALFRGTLFGWQSE